MGRAQLARDARISERNIANLEDRGQRPTAATVRALTDALTRALAEVEGSWTHEQRATFAAGPRVAPGGDVLTSPLAATPDEQSTIRADARNVESATVPSNAGRVLSPPPSLVRSPLPGSASPLLAPVPEVSRPPRRRRVRLLVGVGLTMLALVVSAVFLRLATDRGGPTTSSGQFTTPVSDSLVISPLDVAGSATPSPTEELWVLLKSRNNSFYTVTNDPAPITVDPDGQWTIHTVGVGKDADDIGKRYEFYLVASPRGGPITTAVQSKPAQRHSVAFTRLPPEITVLDTVVIQLTDR